MSGRTGTTDELTYLRETATSWQTSVAQLQNTTNESIIFRFTRDVSLFLEDVHSSNTVSTPDLVDLTDRFYALEAIFRKISDDRF